MVAIDDLVVYIASMVSGLSSRKDLVPRHYAAACLARCNRLLGGMVVLHKAGYPDISGLGLRSILECWYLAVYLLFDPDEGLKTVQGANAYQLSRMDDTWNLPAREEYIASVEPKHLRWDVVAARVGVLLEANNLTEAAGLSRRSYEVVYRGESALSVHGGVGVFMGHVKYQSRTLEIAEIPGGLTGEIALKRMRMAASLVGTLGQAVSTEFSISHSRLNRIAARLR